MKTLFFALFFFGSAAGHAQRISSAEQFEFSSSDSVHKKNKIWLKPLVGAAYGASVYACYRFLDTRIQDESQESKTGFETGISRSVTSFGLGRFHTIAWAGTTATAFIIRDKKLQHTVIVWGGSLLLNGIVTDRLKQSFQRHRPNTGDPYNTFDWAGGPGINKSFPSAHTSNAFTTATVFATMYSDHKWVPYFAYGFASLVGLSRIYDNKHWASDVMAGAAIGFLSAKAMNGLYQLAGRKIHFLPEAGRHYTGLTMICQL
ncbi:MAG TPA: phosphatase PAP2 family protein [Flavisolibacter sp.]|nr:phosphatase PAP2 family protein [Flavisolibacter sp.]